VDNHRVLRYRLCGQVHKQNERYIRRIL